MSSSTTPDLALTVPLVGPPNAALVAVSCEHAVAVLVLAPGAAEPSHQERGAPRSACAFFIDACVPERFASFVAGHDVTTVRAFFRTTDVADGPVLDRITGQFDAFATVDKNLRFEQNLRGRPFRIGLLRTHSNAIENLVPLVP